MALDDPDLDLIDAPNLGPAERVARQSRASLSFTASRIRVTPIRQWREGPLRGRTRQAGWRFSGPRFTFRESYFLPANSLLTASCLSAVYDASTKIPASIMAGNIQQLGNFDQCVGVRVADADTGSGARSNESRETAFLWNGLGLSNSVVPGGLLRVLQTCSGASTARRRCPSACPPRQASRPLATFCWPPQQPR